MVRQAHHPERSRRTNSSEPSTKFKIRINRRGREERRGFLDKITGLLQIFLATKAARHKEKISHEKAQNKLATDFTDYTEKYRRGLHGLRGSCYGQVGRPWRICPRCKHLWQMFAAAFCSIFNGTNLFLGTNFVTWPKELIIDKQKKLTTENTEGHREKIKS